MRSNKPSRLRAPPMPGCDLGTEEPTGTCQPVLLSPSPSSICLTVSAKPNGKLSLHLGDHTQGQADDKPLCPFVRKLVRWCHLSAGVTTAAKVSSLYFAILVVFAVVHLRSAPGSSIEVFNLTVAGEREQFLQIRYDLHSHTVQLDEMSPFPRCISSRTLIVLDKGHIAHKAFSSNHCYLRPAAALTSDELSIIRDVVEARKTLVDKPYVAQVQLMALNHEVHPEIVRSVVGEDIANFCANFKVHWLVSYTYHSGNFITKST